LLLANISSTNSSIVLVLNSMVSPPYMHLLMTFPCPSFANRDPYLTPTLSLIMVYSMVALWQMV
jgi:hypothetical protein